MITQSNSTVHLQEYFKVLKTRFWVIFTILILTVLSGAYVSEEVLPKIYSANTQLEIKPRGTVVVPTLDMGNTDGHFDSTTFQAEFEIMQSPRVLNPVIQQLNLEKKWAREVFKKPVISQQEALDYLNSLLHIDFKRGTDLVVITASDQDPKDAAAIANSVADVYKKMRDAEESDRSNRGTDEIRQQIVTQTGIVEDARGKMNRLREEAVRKGVVIIPGEEAHSSQDDADLQRRESDLLSAREDADARRVLVGSTQKLDDDQFVNTMSAMNREERTIQELRGQAYKLQSDHDNLVKRGYGEQNPDVLALEAELSTIQSQIKALIAGERQALVVDSQMSDSRVDLLNKEVLALKEKANKNQIADLGPYRDAEHEFIKQQSLLDAYGVHLKQVIGDSTAMESPVRIIAPATPPESPSSPKQGLNLVVSCLAGLLLGIMVAFLVEYLDTSVKTMADAESLLGLPVLTVIPNKGGPMPLTAQSARLPHAEGYRILRAKLDLKVQNGVGPSVAMLSGGPGEGKSTTIYNLAVVCAQGGQSVILVDCDLRRPMVHEMVKISNEHGLADYLRGEGDVLDFIQQTALPNLHVLTAGEMDAHEIGALASDKVRNMLDELKQRYDVVLVDSPPVLGISDGSIIARQVDYVILVIQHRRYPRDISLRAKKAIEEVHGNCVGMVLNCVAIKSDDSYYYYSNYGSYYKKKDARKKKQVGGKSKSNGVPVMAGARKDRLESDEF